MKLNGEFLPWLIILFKQYGSYEFISNPQSSSRCPIRIATGCCDSSIHSFFVHTRLWKLLPYNGNHFSLHKGIRWYTFWHTISLRKHVEEDHYILKWTNGEPFWWLLKQCYDAGAASTSLRACLNWPFGFLDIFVHWHTVDVDTIYY